MINLRAKRKYFYFSIIRLSIVLLATLPTLIYALICFIYALLQNNPSIISSQMLLIYLSIPAVIVNIFFIIMDTFYKKRLRLDIKNECHEIISSIKLPEKLPKVVYVYTSHGDMMPARILQNSMQTYKNIEVWISEGSENPKIIEASRNFAKQHNFNFYSVGGNGSSNKSENLNSFLKNVKPRFDYLLITDADEVLDKNFADYAIKCFYSPKFKNLGYVCPLNYCYETENLFSNVMGNSDTYSFTVNNYNRVFINSQNPNLYSASCLISNKLLQITNMKFPEGCLEDYFLESISLRHGMSSFILPNTPCGQAYDKNFDAFIKRTMRVNDWQIYLLKNKKAEKYNEKYSSWFSELFFKAFEPFRYLLVLLLVSLFVWIFWQWGNVVFKNYIFIYFFSVTLGSIFISLICKLANMTYLNSKKFLWILSLPLIWFATIPYKFKHWYCALIRNKYSSFGGSGQKNLSKNRWLISILLISTILLDALIIVLFAFYAKNISIGGKFGFSLLFTLMSFITVIILSIFLFKFINFKIKNYSPDNWIYFCKKI